MKKSPWKMTAQADELTIELYQEIGTSDLFGEATSAQDFADELKAAGPDVRSIRLKVNSVGGNVWDGISIYNQLLTHAARVTAEIDGLAASIASVIVCAAERIEIAPTGMIFVHNPHAGLYGDQLAMERMATALAKVKASMLTAYQRQSPLGAKQISAMLDEETWMTATEAVANGFATAISEGERTGIAANIDLSRFKQVPQKIAAIAARLAPGTAIPPVDRERQRLHLELLRRL